MKVFEDVFSGKCKVRAVTANQNIKLCMLRSVCLRYWVIYIKDIHYFTPYLKIDNPTDNHESSISRMPIGN